MAVSHSATFANANTSQRAKFLPQTCCAAMRQRWNPPLCRYLIAPFRKSHGLCSKKHHAANAFACVHQIEGLVDLGERHGVRDHRVDLDLALHVPVDDFWHVGAAARAAEGGALPDAPGDQLEWTCRDLRAGRGDADNDGLAPTAMAGLQRLAHYRDVAGAVEGVVVAADLVRPALGHVDEVRDQIAANLFRIDEVRHAEALAPFLPGAVDVV